MDRAVPFVFRCSFENVKVLLASGPDLENACRIAAAVAVVRRGPDSREKIVIQDAVAFHAKLVRAEDMCHIVNLQELANDARAEGVPRTAALYSYKFISYQGNLRGKFRQQGELNGYHGHMDRKQ